jgi:AraC-like DNA-binding protein
MVEGVQRPVAAMRKTSHGHRIIQRLAAREAEFGGNHNLLSKWSQGFAEQFFVGERAVGFRRIKERHALLNGGADEGNSSLLFWVQAIRRYWHLIYTVDLPLTFQVEEASRERPYLGFRLNLDSALVASVMMESGIEPRKGNVSLKAMDVSPMDANLLDAVVRLVRLLDAPPDHAESKVLAPLIIREIVFRLLVDGQGARLSHLLTAGKDTQRISKAIGLLRENFAQSIKMEDIAHEPGMSLSGFHHQFKSVTAMSPLQFQKQIRLQEARRLMLGEDLDAASAGYRVGYEDPAYFSRDYKKLFGAPPQRDISKLRSNLEL